MSRISETPNGTSIEATTATSDRQFRGLRRYNLVAA
jgi:hypothetical protein